MQTSVSIYVHAGNNMTPDAPAARRNTALLIDGKSGSDGSGEGWDQFILCRRGDLDTNTTRFRVGAMGNVYTVGDITSDETIFARDFVQTSSESFKENIVPVEGDEATTLLTQLTPVRYNLKGKPDRTLMGFVLEQVPPAVAVAGKGVSIMSVVATLTAVVRAQRDAIDQLTSKVNQLEQRGTP